MFSIREAAERSGLSVKMIRDYDKNGLLGQVQRGANGYRLFDEQTLATLQFIKRARQVNFSLEQIETLLKLRANPARRSQAVKTLVARHIEEINVKIVLMKQIQNTLQEWHDHCQGNDSPDCAIIAQMDGESSQESKPKKQ